METHLMPHHEDEDRREGEDLHGGHEDHPEGMRRHKPAQLDLRRRVSDPAASVHGVPAELN